MNPMRKIRIEKVTINVGTKEGGEDLKRAQLMIKKITGKDSVVTRTHKRNTFGVAKNRLIGAKITLRGEEARKFLEMALQSVENRIKPSSFDRTGNFSFGIKEYINMPGMKYDPDIGIMGFDVIVTLERPGYRVKKRKMKPAKVGTSHRLTPEESIEWAKNELKIKVTDEEE